MSKHRRPPKTNLQLREKLLLSFKSEQYNACSKAHSRLCQHKEEERGQLKIPFSFARVDRL